MDQPIPIFDRDSGKRGEAGLTLIDPEDLSERKGLIDEKKQLSIQQI